MFRLKTTDTEYLKKPYLTYRNFSKYMQSFNMHLSKPSQIGVGYFFLSAVGHCSYATDVSYDASHAKSFIYQLCRNLVEESC